MDLIKKNIWAFGILLFVIAFFYQFIFKGLLPVPADTIVGLYHPFLDYYAKVSPQGVPFQNFLITDPVRQIIPWKTLVVDSFAGGVLPLWNPYEMAGKPLLANFQSSALYPLNFLLFIKPFEISWSVFIMLQPILAGLFMYIYLRNLKIDARASLLSSVAFAFCGFSVVWLEWGNIVSTVLWLPLILFSIDRVFTDKSNKWYFLLTLSLIFSFFAGHLQVFFYLFLLSIGYFIFRWVTTKSHPKPLKIIASIAIFVVLTAIQWVPTLQFIALSARSLDQNPLTTEGWFIPWQHLGQILVPDFFGNPATLNYWGVWNYAEFASYVGIVVLFLAVLSLSIKKQKEIYFFAGVVLFSLIFALPTIVSSIPSLLSIPFLNSAQPTRLIVLTAFSLCVLSAFGFNSLIIHKINKKWLLICSAIFLVMFALLWIVATGNVDLKIKPEDLLVAKRNLIFPTGIFAAGLAAILIYVYVKEDLTRKFLIVAIIAISFFDLFRFGSKFTPFTNPDYFFPKTKVIEFLQKDKSVFRIATTDSRILAPNIATYYKIQTIEGYDPLYLKSYAELIAASEREDHSIKPPFGFNRIITPQNMGSPIIDLLNVKYVLSFRDLPKEEFKLVLSEGQTKVYENLNYFPRAFLVEKVIPGHKNTAVDLFENNLRDIAISPQYMKTETFSAGTASVEQYSDNYVKIKVLVEDEGFLVLSDSYYPTWEASVDGNESRIYKTNMNFRGVVVPKGSHIVEFKNHLL